MLALANRMAKKVYFSRFLVTFKTEEGCLAFTPGAQRHPIYRLSVELIDILSICTSFCCIDCAKEQVGRK